jgi:murein DD-endopeptidase MepM/ murein hydrolase activator NlpD
MVLSKGLWLFVGLLALLVLGAAAGPLRAQGPSPTHVVAPGDTWAALAMRYGVSLEALQAANPHPNRYRQPTIGGTVQLPPGAAERTGMLRRPAGSLLRLALETNQNPWALALLNGVDDPLRPNFYRAAYVPAADGWPRELPPGFATLELSQVPAVPGQAIAYRATASGVVSITARLNASLMPSFANGERIVGVGATGAFFFPGAPELSIHVPGEPLWVQPWQFAPGSWDYDELTLTGAAAEIDQAAIRAEGERLYAIWSQATPAPLWHGPFQYPIDNYLQVSSRYGARRSYNGGPYRTYHEGVDFSAYGGTPVYAAAGGTVVLAEILYVRGGAVLVDHGLGVYSGYYHMSEVHVTPGQVVAAGDQVGEVGSLGLSTGNHLHWDLLAAATWVDAAAWEAQDMGCWLLAGWGTPCPEPESAQ